MRREEGAPDTEPEIVHELLIGELLAVAVPGAVRFLGVTTILGTNGRPVERRVILRFTVPVTGLESVCRAVCGTARREEH